MSVLKRTLSKWSQSFSPDKKFQISTRKIIGNYSYSEANCLGSGYSSSVYKGINSNTNEEVAIKVINIKRLRKHELHLSLLQLQIEILKSVTNQPNILNLYDTYTTKNNVYIITQCCQTDLARIIKIKKNFNLYESLDIISQILSGYLHLSQSGFIHRDLKPANILIKNGTYMIGDFGFAILAGTIKSSDLQYNVGSPLYMAPQSLQDSKYNFSTDMWSIGIILYELIKGDVPWYAEEDKQLYHRIMNKPIATLLDGIPAQCKDFIKRVLDFNPKQRLSPAQALEWLNYFLQLVQKTQQQVPPLKKSTFEATESPKSKPMMDQLKKFIQKQRPLSVSINRRARQRGKSPFRVNKNRTDCYQNPGKMINQPNTPTIIDQPVEYKIRTLYYYSKFIQRILLILTSPLKFQFPSSESLERYLVNILLYKTQRLYGLSPPNNWCKFNHLEQYLKNPNKELQKAIGKAYQKYSETYQADNIFPAIELPILQSSIHQLKKYLQTSFDDKSILLMDYLTTLYQLFLLEQRYDMNKFCTLCKLDTIMERNPTSISQQHLEKLNSKIIILGI